MGLLSASVMIMDVMKRFGVKTKTEIVQSGVIKSVDIDDVIVFSESCGWIRYNKHAHNLQMTIEGESVIDSYDGESLTSDIIRKMLHSYASYCRPIWVYRIPYGRKESSTYMTLDERCCFKEAELFVDSISESCVKWWDNLSSIIRGEENDSKLEIGRMGEYLSILYEEERVKRKPVWQAFDSNVSGYDVISSVSVDDDSKIYIEVKATNSSLDGATFHITRNEWNNATKIRNYCFQLCCFSAGQTIATVSVDMMSEHIPTDNGEGEWEKVEIPFKVFSSLFVDVSHIKIGEVFIDSTRNVKE